MIKTQHCPNCEALIAENEHLKDVYSSATECFFEADAKNERLREALQRIQHFSPAHMWRAPDIQAITSAALGETE